MCWYGRACMQGIQRLGLDTFCCGDQMFCKLVCHVLAWPELDTYGVCAQSFPQGMC